MVALLAFAVTLLVAVLISELADRSVLSTAVLFLVAGFVAGSGMLHLVVVAPTNGSVERLAELALFSILFTDGMRVSVRDLVSAWRLPGRALLLGLPLTFAANALLAHWVGRLPWTAAFLVGAVLSPTDPVFAAAIVGREEVPARLRHLLNVESGLNDGLALPVVVALLGIMQEKILGLGSLGGHLALGVALGIALPWCAAKLESSRLFGVAPAYEPIYAFAIGILVYAVAGLSQGNEYLASFAAGVTVATVSPRLKEEFHRFGETLAELLKLGALLVFGALISPSFLAEVHIGGWLFGVLALVVARPASLLLALIGSELDWRERLTAAWFGPKGFASVVYGLLILQSGVALADDMFHLIAIAIAISILAHSSTDVLIARWFRAAEETAPA